MKNIYYYLQFTLSFLVTSILYSQTLDATLLELQFSNDGYPEKMTKAQDGFYFSSEDDQLWFSDGTTENTFLVKDFDSGFYDEISNIVSVGNSVFFSAHNGRENRELWFSDGTEEGTVQLTERNTSFGTENIYDIIEYKGKVYFGAYSEIYGNELWVSDGTPSGTYVFKDIAENDINSYPNDFFIFKDKLFFKATTEKSGTELWVSDGTKEGTILFKDINEGPLGGMSNTSGYIKFREDFYFFANDGTTGNELWKSDGTSEGTELLKDIRPERFDSNNIMKGAILNDQLVFVANNGVNGNELYTTNGTSEGTLLLKDLNPGSGFGIANSGIYSLVGDKIFFYGSNGIDQTGLWVSDGTDKGTIFINDAAPNRLIANSSNTYAIYYASNDTNDSVLWKSDGSIDGTQIISDVSATNSSIMDDSFLAFNDRIFFSGHTEVNGTELWVTNGTTQGTNLFFDVNHSYGVNPSQLTAVGDRLFFRGNKYGYFGLCTTDGTFESTKYLDINLDGQSIDVESELINFNGKLVLSASDGIHGYELWISDGTQNGTRMVKDIYEGNSSSMLDYQSFTTIGDKLYFSANDGVHGFELWTSDGTESGTYMIKDLRTGGSNYHGYPSNFVSYNGYVYFSSFGHLWRTDGTNQGTVSITSFNRLSKIKVVNNKLLIIAETSRTVYSPRDLWVSDGSSGGTEHIQTFGDGIGNNIQLMTINNNELYFVAKNPENARDSLYKSDGTPEGTVLLYDSFIYHPDADIYNIITCGEYVYFTSQNNSGNNVLWRTDGTLNGTIQILNEDDENYRLGFFVLECFKNNLIGIGSGDELGIWSTTGNVNDSSFFNLEVVNDLSSSKFNSLTNLEVATDNIYFSASTDISGSEVYITTPDINILNVDENENQVFSEENKLIIYPNPSSKGLIHFKTFNYSVIKGFDIYDIYGKKLISEINNKSTQNLDFNVEFLPSGIYIVDTNFNGNEKVTTKLIIK